MADHAYTTAYAGLPDGASEPGAEAPPDAFLEISASPAAMARDAKIFAFATVGKHWWEQIGVYARLPLRIPRPKTRRILLGRYLP